jgi:TusA-related sulfurtransferase
MIQLILLLMLAGDPASCPMHAKHVDARGDEVMGFSHEKTKHTFRLLEDGGAIEVRANDAKDAKSIASIRAHLKEIAADFTAGKFEKPEKIHGRMPDGVDVMLRSEIAYTYEEVERGARVRVKTKDARAREAVHAFLKFQISDHRTGDKTDVGHAHH